VVEKHLFGVLGWVEEIDALPGVEPKEKSRMLLSRETQEGLRITY